MPGLLDDLSALTGEELFNLTAELDRHLTTVSAMARYHRKGSARRRAFEDWSMELIDLKVACYSQIARITIPMREAQGIIWRARFQRGHPVRMVPADS